MRRTLPCLIVLVALAACKRKEPNRDLPEPVATASVTASASAEPAGSAAPTDSGAAPAAPSTAPPVSEGNAALDIGKYPWLEDATCKAPPAVDTLLARFPSPPGTERVPVAPGSFGAWLRTLPLAAEKTPVVSHKGDVVSRGDDPYVAAVFALDVGSTDLQQSSDVVVRLHAEWQWSTGEREISYKSATGFEMPLARWQKGERIIAVGTSFGWAPREKAAKPDHADFRRFLDTVFAFGNSQSLATTTTPVDAADVAPGDFFVHTGSPSHALVVLDIANKPEGPKLALLGQALSPPESPHVIRPGRGTAWFSLRPGQPVITPNTKEFPWANLRRFPAK